MSSDPRSPPTTEKTADIPKAADENEVELELIGVKVQPKPGAPPHWCIQCHLPINIYGRLAPCHHALCWTCASASKTAGSCSACGAAVASVERVLGASADVFVCYAARCRRSYLTEYSLAEHLKLRNHVPAPRTDPFALASPQTRAEDPRGGQPKRSKRD